MLTRITHAHPKAFEPRPTITCAIPRTPLKLNAPALGLVFILTASCASLMAQTTTYIGPTDGDWQNPANWNDGVPAGNRASIVGGKTVNLNFGVATLDQLTVDESSVLNVTDGAKLTAQRGDISYISGQSGRLNVSGAGTVVSFSSIDLIDLIVGGAGPGTLTVDDGGLVKTGSDHTFEMALGTNGGVGRVFLNSTGASRGVLEIKAIEKVSGSIEFNGGVLRANASSLDVLRNFVAGEVTINDGGAFIDSNGFNMRILAPMSGTGSLNKQGLGRLVLSGSQIYTGPTTVEEGTLQITNNFNFDSAITVNAGSALSLDIADDVKLLKGISGAGPVNVTGTAKTARLAGDNTGFTGTFTLPDGSRGMMWSAADAGSAAAKWNLSGQFALVETGSENSTVHLGELQGTNIATKLGAFGGSGLKTFQVGELNTSTSFAGEIKDDETGGVATVALNKVGSGELVLIHANSYTGGTNLSGGGSLVGAFAFSLGFGPVTVTDSSNLRAGGDVHLLNPINIGVGGGTLSNYGPAAHSGFLGPITLNGPLTVAPLSFGPASLTLGGGITGTGDVSIQSLEESDVTISGAPVNPVGAIENQGSTTGEVSISASIGANVTGVTQNSASSRLILNGENAYTGETTVNQGALIVNGSIAGPAVVRTNGTLGGTGTVEGNTTIAGLLTPGNDLGHLTFGEDLTLQPGSATFFEIGGLAPGEFDLISVGDILTFDGTLVLWFINGFQPQVGDSFRLFDGYNGHEGAFAIIDFTAPDLEVNFDYDTGILSFVAVPEPSSAMLVGVSLLGLMARRGRFRKR